MIRLYCKFSSIRNTFGNPSPNMSVYGVKQHRIECQKDLHFTLTPALTLALALSALFFLLQMAIFQCQWKKILCLLLSIHFNQISPHRYNLSEEKLDFVCRENTFKIFLSVFFLFEKFKIYDTNNSLWGWIFISGTKKRHTNTHAR